MERMPPEIEIGKRYGRLVVSKYVGLYNRRQRKYECVCDCGGTTTTLTSSLRSGRTQSCGCYQKDKTRERRNGEHRKCIVCNSAFYVSKWELKRNPKYCGHECYWKNKHDVPWNAGTKGLVIANGGTFRRTGVSFDGTSQEYKSLHYFIRSKFGKPTICSKCGSDKCVDWANKDHRYKKKVEDWIQFCRKCHYKHDNVEKRRIKYA